MTTNRITQLLQMEQQQPDDAFLKFAIALEYVGINDEPKARKYFEALLEKFPDYLPTYYHLGKLYERLNETAQSIYIYKVGIEKAKAAEDFKTAGELIEALTLIDNE